MDGLGGFWLHVFDRWFLPYRLAELKRRGLKVGANFQMLPGTIIDDSHCSLITIGDDVTLAPNVHILAHDASTKKALGYTRIGKVDIGDHVFIGAASIVLPGVRIGSDVVIGAGSLVTADIPDGVVAGGNPARVLATREEWLERRRAEIAEVPRFDESYTLDGGVTEAMQSEMYDKIDRIGYIV